MRFLERLGRKIDKLIFLRLVIFWLTMRSRWSREPVAAGNGPVVSLTTYGGRLRTVYLTIESIAAGRIKPSRLILWLDELQALRNLPAELLRLQNRGLEIRETENFGPHKKYCPYVLSAPELDTPLVTADDDVIYPRWWLQELARGHESWTEDVICYRAREIAFTPEGKLQPYSRWALARRAHPSFFRLPTGVSGVLYPGSLLRQLREAGTAFLDVSPRADDLWLHAQAVRAGIRVRQIFPRAVHFPVLPGSEAVSLQAENVAAGRNDEQARATYRSEDLARIRQDMAFSVRDKGESQSAASGGSDLLSIWKLFSNPEEV